MYRLSIVLSALFLVACSAGRSVQPSGSVAKITVTPALDTLAPGQAVQLTATLKDAAGHVLAGRPVAWSVSQEPSGGSLLYLPDSTVGTVYADLFAGTAYVYATSEGVTGQATVVVALAVAAPHDPYWGGLLDARTLGGYPDSSVVVVVNYVLRPSDSLPMYDSTTIKAGRGEGFFWTDRCFGFSSGQGYVGDYLFRSDIYIITGPSIQSIAVAYAGPDTLAHFTTGIWDPITSPFPGWGDDPEHRVIWRLTLTDWNGVSTPKAPVPILPTAEPLTVVGDPNWAQNCNGK